MCKSVKGIGRSYGGFEPEQLMYLGAGVIGSRALTIPLVKALKLEDKMLSFGKVLLPGLMGYLLLTKTTDEKMHAVGVGCLANATLCAAEEFFPDVLKGLKGVDDTYGVGEVIDLNSSDWSYVSEDVQSGYESSYEPVGQTESNGIH